VGFTKSRGTWALVLLKRALRYLILERTLHPVTWRDRAQDGRAKPRDGLTSQHDLEAKVLIEGRLQAGLQSAGSGPLLIGARYSPKKTAAAAHGWEIPASCEQSEGLGRRAAINTARSQRFVPAQAISVAWRHVVVCRRRRCSCGPRTPHAKRARKETQVRPSVRPSRPAIVTYAIDREGARHLVREAEKMRPLRRKTEEERLRPQGSRRNGRARRPGPGANPRNVASPSRHIGLTTERRGA